MTKNISVGIPRGMLFHRYENLWSSFFGELGIEVVISEPTTQSLAEKILVTRTAVSKWETNKGYPSIDSLKELSNLFGISIDELITDDDKT